MVFLQQSLTNPHSFMALRDPAKATHFSIDGETRPISELDESLVCNASAFVRNVPTDRTPTEGLSLPKMDFNVQGDEQGGDEQGDGLSLPVMTFGKPSKDKADAKKSSVGLSLPKMRF